MKILIVIGTRPNFIKVTQFKSEAEKIGGIEVVIIHTGQHYDTEMAGVFFDQFGLKPDRILKLKGESAPEQFGNMISQLGEEILKEKPDIVIVPGDVNSTLAGALAADRCGIPVYHLEAGLRSFDRTMPEEVNRIIVDQLSSQYFVTEQSGLENLQAEGLLNSAQAELVGNTMIDTLIAYDDKIQANEILNKLNIVSEDFILMTMHRPSNVDNREGIDFIQNLIRRLTKEKKVVFPLHPRTKASLIKFGMWEEFCSSGDLVITQPMDYFSFQKLICEAATVITDSGGIQEETTYREKPCITIRENTERPITITEGTNRLVKRSINDVITAYQQPKSGSVPYLWDGKATRRILQSIMKGL